MRLLAVPLAAAVAATTMVLVPAATAEPLPAPAVANAHPAADHILEVDYQVQETGYWCGPAATRIALSARGVYRSQTDLAAELGTHTGGTDWIGQVTGVLGGYVGWYETREMPNDPPTQEQKDLLWSDIVRDVDSGYAIVANIVAPPGNQPPGYPPDQTIYHYFTVIGYNDVDRTVLIADPASFSGNQIYWLTFDQLASLIPPKGYSA
ncbi:C39 family peptidase [Actinophytocola sp.]|uniref:C39 family peptidase n=1 Tax=Actinophytocola sp. TaxID=1872138 RepID=UPI003D6BA2A6